MPVLLRSSSARKMTLRTLGIRVEFFSFPSFFVLLFDLSSVVQARKKEVEKGKKWISVEEVTDIAEDSRRRSKRLLLAKVKIVQKDVERSRCAFYNILMLYNSQS